jgi:O-antigen/teichoic acid export membrane protein
MAAPLDDASANKPRGSALVGAGSRAIRNTALLMVARVISRVLALVVLIVMNRALLASEFGQYSTVVSISGFVTVIMDVGFNTLYQREAARDQGELSGYLSKLVSVRPLFAVAALVVFACVVPLATHGAWEMVPAGFAMMVLASYSNLLRYSLYAVQRLRAEAVAIVLESLLLLAATLVGAVTHQGPTYYLWAYALTYAFDCVYFWIVLHVLRIARVRWSWDPGFVRGWLVMSLPFALTFVITSIYFNIDQPLVNLIRGSTEAGWYASAYKVFASVLFLAQTVLSVAFPVLSLMWSEKDARLHWAVERLWKGLLAAGWPITIGCVLLAPAFRFIYNYGPSEPAFRILSIGIVFMFVTNTFIGALNSIDHQASFAWAAFWSMVLNVGSNLIAIPLWGYIGASWTTVLTEVFLCGAGFFLLRRHLLTLRIPRLSWRILLAGLIMGAGVFPFRDFTGWLVLPVIVGAAVVYGLALLLLRAVDRDEWRLVRTLVQRRVAG